MLEREFLERSLRSFLDRSAKFANCPVPDCTGILPKIPKTEATALTPEARLVHHCDACRSAVCKRYAVSTSRANFCCDFFISLNLGPFLQVHFQVAS